MKLKKLKNGYSISELSIDEVDVIFGIIEKIDKRGFYEQDQDKETGNWYSSEDFLIGLNNEQRCLLSKIGETIRCLVNV
jgi:hypothetical protein